MQNVRKVSGKRPSHLVRLQYFSTKKYLARYNSALKILFFEMLRDQNLVSKIPPWYSPVQPKPMYENERAKAVWDVPVYAESAMVKA